MSQDSEIVRIDRRLDDVLALSPADAVRLILQEYQIAPDRFEFVAALAAKVVACRTSSGAALPSVSLPERRAGEMRKSPA
jgi:hypothetical protein